MKSCASRFEHIDQSEFGAGKKITSNLLIRFCNNIRGLWDRTEQLENRIDPELRKRFHPLVVHDLHSYGAQLNSDNHYEFSDSTQDSFEDGIGLKKVELRDFTQKEDGIYVKKLNVVDNIVQIHEKYTNKKYTAKNNLEGLKEDELSYYIDNKEKKLYLHGKQELKSVFVYISTNNPYIDFANTTAFVDLDEHVIRAPYTKEAPEEIDQNTGMEFITRDEKKVGNVKAIDRVWDFGWRRFESYRLTASALQDPFAEDPITPAIPTVARAFIIQPGKEGLLTKIYLSLFACEGAEDNAYCEIRKVDERGYPSNHILAREKIRLEAKGQLSFHPINFTTPPHVQKGKNYAVVLRSVFTSTDKSYGLGGWTHREHNQDIPSQITFNSIDNCRSWFRNITLVERYGLGKRFEDPVDYRELKSYEGQLKSYSYQTIIKPLESKIAQEGSFVVQWKPLVCNPIKSVQLAPSYSGNVDAVVWEVSVNMVDWHRVSNPDWSWSFENGKEHERNRNHIYVRAALDSKAVINGLKVIVSTEKANEAYVKTLFYNPRLSNPLGASLWSGLGTDIELIPPESEQVNVEVDVIRNTDKTDYFEYTAEDIGEDLTFKLEDYPAKPLIEVTMYPLFKRDISQIKPLEKETESTGSLEETHTDGKSDSQDEESPKPSTPPVDGQKQINDINEKVKEVENLYNNVKNSLNPQNTFEEQGKKLGALILDLGSDGLLGANKADERFQHVFEDLNDLSKGDYEKYKKAELLTACIDLLKVIARIKKMLTKDENIDEVNILPVIPGREVTTNLLTENRDYMVDYDKGTLKLNDSWGSGRLQVKYHPLWMKGLKLEDFPLKTDVFKEYFIGTGVKDVFKLKAVPLDPVRVVEVHNSETNDWEELKEDEDYMVNYGQKEIRMFQNTAVSDESNYKVVYTPYLAEDGLALAYRMNRENYTQQAKIRSCYYQNRV